MNALILATLLASSPEVGLHTEAHSARLTSEEADDLEAYRSKATRLGATATGLGLMGAISAVGGGIYIATGPQTCSGWFCIPAPEGYLAIFVGAVFGVVAINLAIVAIMYVIKAHILGKREGPSALTVAPPENTCGTARVCFEGDRRLDDRRATVAASGRGQVLMTTF